MVRKMMNIDADKLQRELTKRGLKGSKVGLELGYSDGMISSIKKTGRMTVSFSQMLESSYNIKPETYVIPEDNELVKNEDAEAGVKIDYRELYNCIYGATYQAVKRFASETEFFETIGNAVYYGTSRALEE